MKNIYKVRHILLLMILSMASQGLSAATANRVFKFWVSYKDKLGTPYSILKPWDFLSQKALDRRYRAGKTVGMEDLPINPAYSLLVKKTGVQVLLNSRWMNASLVATTDSSLAKTIKELTIVSNVELMGVWNQHRGPAATNPDAFEEMSLQSDDQQEKDLRIKVRTKKQHSDDNFGYGLAWQQINQLNGYALHKNGYRGKGVLIAVLDAGFYRANHMEAFDSLRAHNGIVGTKDFVDFDNSVYNDDDHGTQVLSCMAANVRDVMIGTAPDASYLLLRTEDHRTEYPSEEAQWLAGAEMADSAGADLINSSLGYTEFDRPGMGHSYQELDGKTTLITRAANMAWERGIIVVNSAGNEGDGTWRYIGAPADAAGVIAVGAVAANGRRASFSSVGPTADGRIKPDLAAMGKNTIVAGTSGYFSGSNGTSFSSPVLCGMIACFVQYAHGKSPADIRRMVQQSGNHFLGADSLLGSGIPDFGYAMQLMNHTKPTLGFIFTNWVPSDTVRTSFDINTLQAPSSKYYFTLKGGNKALVAQGTLFATDGYIYGAHFDLPKEGKYSLEVRDGEKTWTKTFYYIPFEEEFDY